MNFIPKSMFPLVTWQLQPGQLPCLWDYLQAAHLECFKMELPKYWGEPQPGQVKSLYKSR